MRVGERCGIPVILKLYKERQDTYNKQINYEFRNVGNLVVAIGKNCVNEGASVSYDGIQYCFKASPKFMKTEELVCKYPIASKGKKTVGFQVCVGEKVIAEYYQEAVTCKKKWIFKQNIIFTVFKYAGQIYMLFKVGFCNENCHYYCLYDNNNMLLAVIERHSYQNDNCIATLYIEDASHTVVTLIACAEEVIWVSNVGHRDSIVDTSAGKYISVLDEEKGFFDRNFVERIKASV